MANDSTRYAERSILALVFCIFLAACGGGGSSNPEPVVGGASTAPPSGAVPAAGDTAMPPPVPATSTQPDDIPPVPATPLPAEDIGGAGDASGAAVQLSSPLGIVQDSKGDLIVADFGSHAMLKVSSDGRVTTFAGMQGAPGYADGQGSTARFNAPDKIAIDRQDNLYVTERGSKAIRKITPSGVVSTLAGSASEAGTIDGMSTSARFYFPSGIAVDSAGNVYITDLIHGSTASNPTRSTIRKITPSGMVSTMIVMQGGAGFTGFQALLDITVDSSDNLYVLDGFNWYGSGGGRGFAAVRKVSPGGEVTLVAGSFAAGLDDKDGAGTAAVIRYARAIVADRQGRLLVSSETGIRAVTQDGVVTTISGTKDRAGAYSGVGDIAVDAAGNMVVTDSYGIRRISPSGSVTTVAGR